MAFGWDDAAMLGVGAISTYMGQKSAKKAARAATAAEADAERRRLAALQLSPEEQSRQNAWNRMAAEYAAGRAMPGEDAAFEQQWQVARAQRGQDVAASRMQLGDYLARRGESGSAAGLAQLQKIDESGRRDEAAAGIAERAARIAAARERMAQGYSMMQTAQQQAAQQRTLMANALAPASSAAAGYYGGEAAGYGELGSELIGRGLEGASNWWSAKAPASAAAAAPANVVGAADVKPKSGTFASPTSPWIWDPATQTWKRRN